MEGGVATLRAGDSAGSTEVCPGVALDHGVLSVGGVTAVCLPTAVGVGAGALGHGEHQLRATSAAGLEHGVGDLPTSVSDSEVEAGSGGGVDHDVLLVGDAAIVPDGGQAGNPSHSTTLFTNWPVIGLRRIR